MLNDNAIRTPMPLSFMFLGSAEGILLDNILTLHRTPHIRIYVPAILKVGADGFLFYSF